METKEEYARGVFESRRRDFLREMNMKALGELLPATISVMDLYHEEDWDKEELIDLIITNYWDKGTNPEAK